MRIAHKKTKLGKHPSLQLARTALTMSVCAAAALPDAMT
jgi:hypothetical protein